LEKKKKKKKPKKKKKKTGHEQYLIPEVAVSRAAEG